MNLKDQVTFGTTRSYFIVVWDTINTMLSYFLCSICVFRYFSISVCYNWSYDAFCIIWCMRWCNIMLQSIIWPVVACWNTKILLDSSGSCICNKKIVPTFVNQWEWIRKIFWSLRFGVWQMEQHRRTGSSTGILPTSCWNKYSVFQDTVGKRLCDIRPFSRHCISRCFDEDGWGG